MLSLCSMEVPRCKAGALQLHRGCASFSASVPNERGEASSLLRKLVRLFGVSGRWSLVDDW